MHVLDHLEELRKTLTGCVLAFIVGVAVVGSFLGSFSNALIYPYRLAMSGREDALQGLVTTGPMGVFSVIIQVCFLGGLLLALPVMLYMGARFLAPALTERERRFLRPACFSAFILFILGASFSYFFLVPISLKASIYLNEMFGYATIWRADSYYDLLLWMVLGVGASFEFPLLIIALVRLGIVSVAQLRIYRPHAIVVFLVLAAVITPTGDPVTMLLLAIPMWLFYEGAIFVCLRIESRTTEA